MNERHPQTTSLQPFALTAEFTARSGKAEDVAALLSDFAGVVRQEEGNVLFDCYRRTDDSSRFFVYEVYRDEHAFRQHIAAEYGAEFNARLVTMIVEPQSVLTFLTPLSVNLTSP
ncbi:putative quinol monooxygenase [Methylovirgula sp. 4M-Z18]|uniref:putative quinol monooxygenase n=1 Tax=Methylovirgula sp. 4M-Z18 TaxID=2293567 RepID=UPI000E2E7183|nr:putative quinol monooxygenase [Methylovirgula sp. 4M-Z18]RFB78189.1 antibiotic biosynthesis monooxygenase [Methylovirgula sp. 4M-Z18]